MVLRGLLSDHTDHPPVLSRDENFLLHRVFLYILFILLSKFPIDFYIYLLYNVPIMIVYIHRRIPTEGFLVACLADYLLIPEDEIVIHRTPNGKPYLLCHDVHFSVSHSADYIIIAICDTPVGADIELIKDRDYLRFAKRWFSPEEIANVEVAQAEAFYMLWTAKEAYTKLRGYNLNTRVTMEHIKSENINIRYYDLIDNHLVCVVSEGNVKVDFSIVDNV